MSVKLHRSGFDHAKQLIEDGKVVLDERDDWSEHQPSAREENEFISQHGIGEFGRSAMTHLPNSSAWRTCSESSRVRKTRPA
jgi:hypothetical protein